MFDIFYYGAQKPSIFPELIQFASSLADAKARSRTKYFWYIDGRFDYTNFDFTWFPAWSEVDHTHIILCHSQYEEFDVTFAPKDIGIPEVLNYHKPRRYVPRVASKKYWTIPDEVDASTIDFTWAPPHYDPPYIYHFGSEFQQSIGLIYSVPGATDIKFIGLPPKVEKDVDVVKEAEVFFVDMNNADAALQFELIKSRYPNAQSLRFMNGWVETIKRCLAKATSIRFWVISSENDYSDFNFNWHPSAWQTYMLHVFPTGEQQKFGDTFYVHGPSFKSQANNSDLTTWYNVNYCEDQRAVQLLPLIVTYDSDSIVDAIKSHKFTGTYTWFKHESITDPIPTFITSSWGKKYRSVHVFSKSGSVLAVPRDIQLSLNSQVYDYNYIEQHDDLYVKDKPLDIVYISNGEPDAEKWYDWLVALNPSNKIHRVKNINGRTKSFHAAAEISETPWYFAVWAKLEVSPLFGWDWQPDYMQQPKHYIFNANNPVNGLVYGHMAIVAYNKKLVLDTINPGLDFTLSQEHEVVDMLSGTAHFNVSPIMAWRTAFRECIKLKCANDMISAHRLNVWRTTAIGFNAAYTQAGANDAVKYYNSVNGDMKELMKSFEWEWTDEYFNSRYLVF